MSPAPAQSPIERAVGEAVRASLSDRPGRVVLAVSGGLDSMVLLDAAASAARDRIATVATFDHRSGAHARAAATFVEREAAARQLPVVVGVARRIERSEAGWRASRWSFLADAARTSGAAIATAHTADDQLETVCMRVLRGSGARGLAGLLADSPVRRPLLGFHRADLAEYAAVRGVRHVEDPTNESPEHLRNRIRHDLLPAIARVQEGFAGAMLRLAEEAASVRRALNEAAAKVALPGAPGRVVIPLTALEGMPADSIAALAPALAARAGLVLDRRGTTRLSQFILMSRTGARIQLSGGGEVMRIGDVLVIHRTSPRCTNDGELPLAATLVVGAWRFRRVAQAEAGDVWAATLPSDRALTVRGWRAGDRMRAAGSPAARRVKRFFSDAGIAGPERTGWPVVLADGEIVWIPGVRRSDAATDRSGRPVLRYRCERNNV